MTNTPPDTVYAICATVLTGIAIIGAAIIVIVSMYHKHRR